MPLGPTPRPSASYPGTSTYLRLVRERISTNADYDQLFVDLFQLNTYITQTNPNDLKSDKLTPHCIAVMKEAHQMGPVITADQPVKDADVAFWAEMLTVLGQVTIREDEARPPARKLLLMAAAGGAFLGAGAVVLGPTLATGALGLIGFGGSVAGSIAGVPYTVYGGAVAFAEIFRLYQSAAMGSVVVGSNAEVAAGAAALGVAAQRLLSSGFVARI